MKILLCTLNARFFHVNLALHSIRSNQPKEDQNEVLLKEYTINQDLRDIMGDILSHRADVLAFGVYIWNKGIIFRLAGMIKAANPDIRIVLGGPEVSYDPEEFLSENEWIDAIVLGEGEHSFWQLMVNWTVGNREPILGVAQAWETNSDYRKYQEIEDLSQLAFAYEKTSIEEIENRIAYYESSRGCPFSCSYCLSGLDGRVRNRETQLVKTDLDKLIAKKIKQIKFVDRTFNANPNHFNEIIKYLAELKNPLNFHFEMDAAILKEETVDILAMLPKGRVQLEIGIQSTSQKTLEAVGRHHAFEKESTIIRKLKQETEIHLHLDLIAGLPYEGKESFQKSFNDVFALAPHQLQLGFLKMLRGSQIRRESDQYGYRYDKEAPYEVVVNPWLSAEEFHQLRMVEHCLEETWNAGRFKRTLDFLFDEVYKGDFFRCFLALAEILQRPGNLMIGRNGKWWGEAFFCEISKNIEWEKHTVKLLALLKWDILVMEKGKWKPDFIQWSNFQREAFWRDEERVRQYIPEYQFTTWRNVHRNYGIEKFPLSIIEGGVSTDKEVEIIIQLEEPFRWWKMKK